MRAAVPASTTGADARTARLHCQGDLGLTEMLWVAYRVRKFEGELRSLEPQELIYGGG